MGTNTSHQLWAQEENLGQLTFLDSYPIFILDLPAIVEVIIQ